MKKLILILAFPLIVNLYSDIYAQSGWYNTFVNNPNYITKILSSDLNTYFCFTSTHNMFLKSTNSGDTWSLSKFSDSLIDIRDGQFLNSQTGWIVGTYHLDYTYKPYLFKTTNGGLDWNGGILDSSVISCLWSTFFLNENTGWIGGVKYSGGTGKILKTIDGGLSWNVQSFPGTNIIRRIRFINGNTGWFTGDFGSLYKTTDSGITWNNVSENTPIADKIVSDFFTIDGIKCWLLCAGIAPSQTGYIYYTTNSGINWNTQYTYSDSAQHYFYNINFINNSTGYVSGSQMDIYKTTNSGSNWISIHQISTVLLSMCFSNNNNSIFAAGGYLFGAGNWVIRSTNTGVNWIQCEYDYYHNFFDVNFADLNTGLVQADGNRIYKTINRGDNWDLVYHNDTSSLGNIAIGSDSTVLIGLHNKSSILRSTNYGSNWQEIQTQSAFDKIKFSNQTTAWATKYYDALILKSTNKGIDWVSIALPQISDYIITDLYFLNETTGWLLAYKKVYYENYYHNSILRTTNAGNNWDLIYNTTLPSGSYYDTKLKFQDENNGIMINVSSNRFKRTNNAGFSWLDDPTNFPSNIYDIYMINNNTGWCYGESLGLYKTMNGGVVWAKQNPPIQYCYAMYALNINDVWLCALYDKIYHTTNGGNVFVENNSSFVPQKFRLFQNSPNPFNPNTKIHFEIPAGSSERDGIFTSLKIYDITGKEIITLINERLVSGGYNVSFDGSNLPSGVYFYRLSSDYFSETKKMILLK